MMGVIIEETNKHNIPYYVINYVYNNTPVNNYGTIDEYSEYLNNSYNDYYITRHSSDNDEILRSSIKTPEELGIKYNSMDGFFVSQNLKTSDDTSYRKKSDKISNYYVMIPKSLNYLHTDYNFSNISNFFDDYQEMIKRGEKINVFKYYGDKVRELGYDVVIPDGGKHEWIVVNPDSLIVLGSKKDIKQFIND
jgi:hypothetical protein